MDKFIAQNMEIATKKFLSFGFKKEQIEQLLTSGRRDLEQEIGKLKILLSDAAPDTKKINQSMHALKGLLYNLGNTEAGDVMTDLGSDMDTAKQIVKIKEMLGLS